MTDAPDIDPREVAERFRRVVEHLPAIVYIEADEHEPEMPGRLLYVSPQVEMILGFAPQDWLEDPLAWARQFHPDDLSRFADEHRHVGDAGETSSSAYRLATRDGRFLWFRDHAEPVRDESGTIAYWQGLLLDITAERESEQRYRTLVEQLPAIVYVENVEDSGLQVVYINPQVEELLGISTEEWIDAPGTWQGAIHPDDVDAVLAANEEADATGEPFAWEYRMVARDGRVLWFHDEARMVYDEDGQPRHWQGVMMDVTARRKAEAGLAEAEARYRALVEQNPTITYIDGIEGDRPTLYISPQTTTILGYTPQDWYAEPGLWGRIVMPEDRERIEAEEALHPTTYRLRAKDGHLVWIHDQSKLITDDSGHPRYWQGVMVDITQQRRTEKLERDLVVEREEADRLRAEDEMKRTFLQTIAHDVRTPLAAILGLALTLDRNDVIMSEDEQRDYARRIAQNARRLDRMVADLLDLERLDRGLAVPDLVPVDLGALIRELVASSDLAADRRLAVDVAPIVIRADAAMLERLIENLLGNAVKHTPGDSRIWIHLERMDDGVVMSVEDDGPGVAAEDRERIFEPFRQGMGAPTGSGVGLALVVRFAELHGGKAWVDERLGGGAAFHVFLSSDPRNPAGPGISRTREDQPTGNGSSAEASQA